MAQLAIAAAGAALGAATLGTAPIFLGLSGTAIGWTLGSIAGSFLTPTQKSKGPRLDDLKVSSGEYGQGIPWIQGHPRVAGQVWWASDRREIATTTEVGKGGGGAEYTEYTYEVDLLLGLSDNEIQGISRVWSNGALVWTKRADGTAESALSSKAQANWDVMTVYTGGADQLPDPIYEAVVGVGNAPAYRGRGTVMLQGLKLGNSGQLPNLTFEVYTQGDEEGFDPLTLIEDIEDANQTYMGAVHFETPSFRVHYADSNSSGTSVKVFEFTLGEAEMELVATYTKPVTGSVLNWSASDVSGLMAANVSNTALYFIEEGAALTTYTLPYNMNVGSIGVVYARRGNDVVVGNSIQTGNTFRLYRYAATGGAVAASGAILAQPVRYITIAGDFVYAADAPGLTTATTAVYVLDLATLTLQDTLTPPAGFGNELDGQLITDENEQVYLLGSTKVWRLVASAWVLVKEFSGTLWSSQTFRRFGVFGGDVFALSYFNPERKLKVLLDTVDLTEPTLRSVVEALCARAGMPAGTYDASALASITRPVRGLAVANVTSARSIIEQLAAAYFFEAYLSDKLYFVPRGGAVALAVDNADLGAGEGGAAAESLPVTVASDVEIPAQISLSYANVDGDYNTATEHSDRLLTGVVSTSAVQMPLGMTAAEAKGVADAMLQDAYAGRITGSAALGQAYSRLVPTDVVTLTDSDGTAYRARLVRRNDDGLVISFDWVLDDVSALVSAGITSDDYAPSLVVSLPGPTNLELLDIPLLRDADDTPGIYAAVKPSGTTTWPGALVYSSLDGVEFTELAPASSRAIFGVVTVALTSYTGGNVFDHAGSVTVDVGAGTLASASRDAVLDSEANAMLVGSEVIQFMTATFVSAGVYKLTGLLRGRRGTEWAMTGHAIDERAVLLRTAGLLTLNHEAARIGLPQQYKAVTLGKTLASAKASTITDTAVRLKPWAPADLRQDLTASQLTLTWSRRTRLSTRFLSSSTVPLGESAEAYDVDLINGASQVVLSERVTAPTWQFSGAAEVARDAVGYVFGYDYAGSAFGVTLEGAAYSWKYLVQHVAGVSTSQLYLGNQVNEAIGVGSQFYASAVDVNSSGVVAVVSASTLYRVDLSAPTVTAAQRSAATLNDVFSLAHDGTNLWAVESESGNLLRLNDSTLATVNTYAVGGKPRGLQYGGGFLYWFDQATGEAVKWEIATTSETWRELTGGGAQGGVLRLAGSLLFNAGGGGIQALNISDGSVAASHAYQIGGVQQFFDYDGAILCLILLPGAGYKALKLNASTGAEEAQFGVGAGVAISKVVADVIYVAESPTSDFNNYDTVGYEITSDLTGYTAKVYQISATVGRGYPATLSL